MPTAQRPRLSGKTTSNSKSANLEVKPLHSDGVTTELVKQVSANLRGLSPANMQQLQRSVGNRAINRALAQSPRSQPSPIQNISPTAPVIQRKRQLDQIDQEELNSYKGSRAAIEISANYDESLIAGNKLRDKAVKWYGKARDSEKPVSSEETLDKVTKAGYKDFWIVDGKKITVNTTRGSAVADLESKEVDSYKIADDFEDDQDFLYSNSFDTESGVFHASVNYRDLDQESADEEGLSPALPNSEIIWHQHKLAQQIARQKASGEGDDTFRPSRLNAISREQISNEQTLDTIFMSDGGSQAMDAAKVTIEDGRNPDAWALLGTPNGTSSLWLLMQHGHEEGATDIESVTYTKDGLLIRFMFE